MVGVFGLLTARRVTLAFAVLLIAIGVAGRLATAADSVGPSASFTVDPGTAHAGDTISFSSTSSDDGSLVSQEWDFDDGETGSGSDVQHTYAIPGVYTVRLTVTDDENLTATTTQTVTVENRNPIADFHFSPAAPLVGQTVDFTSDATDPEGRIDVQRWDLDDDGIPDQTGATASTTFTSGGPHTVTLIVEDKDGGTNTLGKTVDVIDPPNQAPDPSFNFEPTDPMILDVITFTSKSTDSDGSIVTTEWDFEDDGTFDASGTQVTHSYAIGMDYTVRLRVTDNEGLSNEVTKVISVGVPPNDPPTAGFTVTPGSPKTLETVSFDSTSADPDGTIVSYGWEVDGDDDFNDRVGPSFSNVFTQSGTYPVALKVTDDDGATGVVSKNVVVANRQPTSDFEYSPANPQKNEAITFTSLATDPENRVQSLEWDLDNDGQFDDAVGATAQWTFGSPGNKPVKLKITDRDGGTNTATKTVAIASKPPTASFVFSPTDPLSLQRVTFTSTSSDPDGGSLDVRWDTDNDGSFDDGSDIEASRVFTSPGSKTVRIRVTDDDGNQVIASNVVTVTNRPPTAVIDAPSSAPKNTSVTFKSRSEDFDGSISKTEWDTDGDGYDDGTGSQVSKSFPTTGLKTIRLRVTDDSGAIAETVFVINIDASGNLAPVANFTISSSSPLTNTDVTFTSTSTDSDGSVARIEWDLDHDGEFELSSGSVKTAKRQFSTPGPQIVTLRVTDEDGATDTLEKTVNVLNRTPAVTSIGMGTAAPVSLEPVTFTVAASDQDGTVTSRLWDFDDDGFDDGSGESVPWTFLKKGTYNVRVKVIDDFGATAIGSRSVNVANTLPRASFAHDPPSPNPRDAVTMTSTSVDPDGSITKIEWDTDNDGAFDDGTGQKVTKTFPNSGNQTVRLRVTDDSGDTAIGSQTIVIGNRPPTASFDYRPAAPITGQLVTLFSTSDDPDKNIEQTDWDLDGDGSFETSGSSAGRTFPAGTFNVSMRVTDTEGSFAIVTQTVVVGVPPAIPKTDSRLRALSPFPIVRMAGRIGRRGTNFRLLSVDAPRGATVTVRCKGRRCPFGKTTRAARAPRKLRIRKLERRLLRTGTLIRIYVTQAGTIGKYTSIKIRGGKPPKRIDRCLMPGNLKPVQCPS